MRTPRATAGRSRLALLAIAVAVVLTLAAPTAAAADAVPPLVDEPVLAPAVANGGQSVTVTSSATDDSAVASAEVQVDGGPWTPMSGAFGSATVGLSGTVGASGVTAIEAGTHHACALLGDGILRCWGRNYDGQIGDGTSGVASWIRSPAVGLPDLSGVTAVSLGDHHSCALVADTTVRCWGHNFAGQLGDGTTVDRLTPTPVQGLTGVTALAVGSYHNCALLSDATVACWGWNSVGEVGDGSTTNRLAPVGVTGLSDVVALAAGNAFTCAALADGTASCWGINQSGQLGTGDGEIMHTRPVAVPGLTGVTAIGAGDRHACALLDDATVRCWGVNEHGQLGDGSTTNRPTPVPVTGLEDVTALVAASGGYHTCAVLIGGSVRCWGSNASGAVGDGAPAAARPAPVAVVGLSPVAAIAAGSEFTCALGNDAVIRCWGANGWGSIGDGTGVDRTSPTPVAGLAGNLPGGQHQVCVRATDDDGNTSDGTACATLTVRYGHTPVGPSIRVRFGDAAGGPSDVSATFDAVTTAGESTALTSASGPSTPDAFVFGDPVRYYDLSTTAAVSAATLCIDTDGVDYPDGSELRLYRQDGSDWTEVTHVRVPPGSPICGRTATLGRFVVVQFRYGTTPVTPPGGSVDVTFADAAGAASPVHATFVDVTAGGISTATTSPTGPTPPATFQLGDPPVYYELTTTAVFGSATVCIDFAGVGYQDPTLVRLLHLEDGTWTDVTTSLDPWTGTICGVVDSFSPFIVAQLHYAFGGFLAPVDGPPVVNLVKAGSAVPVKFSLGGDAGSAIFEAGYPKVERVACDTHAPLDELEETATGGKSGLSYDPGTGRYTYAWKSSSGWAGTCRQLVLRLADGSEHRASFSFRK